MKEIVNKLHEQRQIELAKSILESNGYKAEKKLIESAVDEFWNLHEKDYKTGTELESILDKLGIDPWANSEDGSISEEEAQKVLDVFKSNHKGEYTTQSEYDEVISQLESAGFSKQYVDHPESGSVEYYVKGTVGVLVSSIKDIRSAAECLL